MEMPFGSQTSVGNRRFVPTKPADIPLTRNWT